MSRRLVYVDPGGRHTIFGAAEDPLPVTLTLEPLGGPAFVSLVKVTPRMAVYKAPLVPASYSFHQAQQ